MTAPLFSPALEMSFWNELWNREGALLAERENRSKQGEVTNLRLGDHRRLHASLLDVRQIHCRWYIYKQLEVRLV